MNSYAELQQQIQAAKSICKTLLKSGIDPTPAELEIVQVGLAAGREMKELNNAGTEAMRSLSQQSDFSAIERGFLDFEPAGRRAIGDQLAKKMTGGFGSKALLTAGTATLDIVMLPKDPIGLGKVPQALTSVIPVIKVAGNQAAYLAQTVRTGAAAAVAPGTLKPLTDLGLARRTALLQVIAVLSSPIDRFDLEDSQSLKLFVEQELIYSVGTALEGQILTGNGTAPNLTGLTTSSGIQTVAAGADIVSTLRKAITALETVGQGADLVFVLSPAAWEAAELARNVSGAFDLSSSPVDRNAQKVWGVPVVLSTQVPAGKAVIFSQSAVGLYVDQFGLRVDWSSPGATWTLNQVQARAELRAALALFQPQGVALITLPA